MKTGRRFSRRQFLASSAVLLAGESPAQPRRSVSIVPNFHPASCGWLTNFSKERVYCANSYFDHLDRVRDDPSYAFVLSECNNMIAMLNFQPGRREELQRRIREGRVELVNAFFLEATINLSGGEALVRQGIEGLRWQQAVFGVRPRWAWCIDVCGTHDQMAQITAGLGLEAIAYTRKNPTGRGIHWFVSPDGTRTVAVASGHYSDLGQVFAPGESLTAKEIDEIKQNLAGKAKRLPPKLPLLVLGGKGDYSLAPARKNYPGAFLKEWAAIDPSTEIRFSTFGEYMDCVLPMLRSGEAKVPTLRGGTEYDFHSFWIQSPRVKTQYRQCEHTLQAAEMLASVASLNTGYAYPSQPLYRAWLQLLLNMDRNTLWGAAGGMVFEHEKSWDAQDRFNSVLSISNEHLRGSGAALAGNKTGASLFNALNWERRDPVVLEASQVPAGSRAEALPDGKALCLLAVGPASMVAVEKAAQTPAAPQTCELPEVIDTKFYTARVDPRTGHLVSLKPKPSGREILGGPADVIVMEKPAQQRGDPGDHMQARPDRKRVAGSTDGVSAVQATRGPLALTVKVKTELAGAGPCTRVVRFYNDSPRIDFETTLRDIPDRTVVVSEFPLARDVLEVRRGIPYGFSHGAWSRPNPDLHGWTRGIVPAVRWSHYEVEGGGMAILDQGLSGRELNERTPIIYLLNATDKYYGYPNPWLSGKGEHVLRYAILAHDGDWRHARIPHAAWEYNSPLFVIPGSADRSRSWLETSPNLIVESMRREERFLEVRAAECLGYADEAEVKLALPYKGAWMTNLVGGDAKKLDGGPAFRFKVRPQQIVTLRFDTAGTVPAIKPLLEWDPLVPSAKRAALHEYSSEKGHPPRGN